MIDNPWNHPRGYLNKSARDIVDIDGCMNVLDFDIGQITRGASNRLVKTVKTAKTNFITVTWVQWKIKCKFLTRHRHPKWYIILQHSSPLTYPRPYLGLYVTSVCVRIHLLHATPFSVHNNNTISPRSVFTVFPYILSCKVLLCVSHLSLRSIDYRFYF